MEGCSLGALSQVCGFENSFPVINNPFVLSLAEDVLSRPFPFFFLSFVSVRPTLA